MTLKNLSAYKSYYQRIAERDEEVFEDSVTQK